MAIRDTLRWLISFGLGCFCSIFVLLGLFVYFVRHPIAFFSRKKRDVMPSVLNDPDLGTHGYVHLADVKIHYVAQGDEAKPLMLFVHGFPEFWYSWRFQLREFKNDYRVVAIDMRGYGDSDKPSGVANYQMSKLVTDLKQIIAALGYRSCVLVGLDWGAVIARIFASKHPHLVDKLITMNCPRPDIIHNYLETHMFELKKVWYILFFQVPFLPELMLLVNDMKLMETAMAGPNGNLMVGTLSTEDMEAYKYALSRPGAATAVIDYYRAFIRFPPRKISKISCPLLVIWGCKDAILDRDMSAAAAAVVDNQTVKYIEEAGHWVMMDTPDIVNKHMRDFLK